MSYHYVRYKGKVQVLCTTCLFKGKYDIIPMISLKGEKHICACCKRGVGVRKWHINWKAIINKLGGSK